MDPRKPKALPRTPGDMKAEKKIGKSTSQLQERGDEKILSSFLYLPQPGPAVSTNRDRKRLFYASRPSDGRGLGMDPGPPYAFKMSMFNVFCNSH
jgi:hypothetical protein